jgi:hypothetical protein
VQVIDEDSIPFFQLAFLLFIPDDVDAPEERPAPAVDLDGDGVPEFPVYFSLAPATPIKKGASGVFPNFLVSLNKKNCQCGAEGGT